MTLQTDEYFGYSLVAESENTEINVYGGTYVSGWYIAAGSLIVIHGCEMTYDNGRVQAILRDRSSIDIPVEYGPEAGRIPKGSLQFRDDCPEVEEDPNVS